MADAFALAIERAFPNLSADEHESLCKRFLSGNAAPSERAAIWAEFAKVTRADIGRGALIGGAPCR